GDPIVVDGSFICAPVRARGEVIGVINLTAPSAFSSTDLHFLNAVMTSVGYAVDNARMLEDSRQSAGRLQQALDDVKAAEARLAQRAVDTATLREPEASSPIAPHAFRILLIDDQRNVRRTLADVLGAEGHCVVDVGGGAEGLAHLEHGEPFDA